MFDPSDPDLIRDLTNARGTRYIKMKWGIARDRDNVWFCLVFHKNQWMAGFRDHNKGVEIKFRIIPAPGVAVMKAMSAYRAALDTYAAFVLGDKKMAEQFEIIEIASNETRH